MVETEVNNNKDCCACCGCCAWWKKSKSGEIEETTATSLANDETTTIENIPYECDLDGKLTPGQLICVAGYVPAKCHRFSINLKCGSKDPNADIAFHFNPRLEQRYVVRNCRINGHWGTEDTSAVVKFPFQYNKKFDVRILVADQEFMVIVNGVHWCAFSFRLPLEKVDAMDVKGDVDVDSVEFRNITCYPEVSDSHIYPTITYTSDSDDEAIQDLSIPFTGILPKPFTIGWELNVVGRVKLLPHTFYINLQSGAQLWPHPIIPLHLNPRFCTKLGEAVFVRNYWSDGSWGAEERTTMFPFSPGGSFHLVIRKETEHFSVWVDGQLTGEFPFKIRADKINCIYVQGDVVVHRIELSEKRKGQLHPKFADDADDSS